jgi:putative ABC transport system permease protein
MDILKNLWRRKLRTTLTVTGIVMGIFALTTMGSLAEHFNVLLNGGVTYFSGSIQVADDRAASGFGGGYMTLETVDRVAKVKGVAAAGPTVGVLAKPGAVTTINFGVPDFIANYDPRVEPYSSFKLSLKAGRWINDTSRGEVVLGTSLAAEFHKRVGDNLALPVRPADAQLDFVNHRFTVVGLLTQTLTAPDNGAYISLHDAQTLLGEGLPAAVRGDVDRYRLISGVVAFGRPGVNLDKLADAITAQVSGVKATRPTDLVNSFKAGGAVFTFMTTAAALLALIIGGLSVVNTMIMSVTERVREIGLKKALGAKMHHILTEFLAEATLMGVLGGAVGFLLGAALTLALDSGDPSGGLFLITPRLIVLSLGFAIALGAGAGVLPAIRGARMDPVSALRSS